MVALRKSPPTRMTVDEFLSWDSGDRSGARWQLIDGEPVMMSPASDRHAALQSEISRRIGNHLVERDMGCQVLSAPGVVPRVRANMNFRIPDLAVTCSPLTGDSIVQDPILLIEILSPSNEAETWANIWAYTTIPSVQEILSVRSTRMEVSLLRRGPDGMWPDEGLSLKPPSILEMASIGFAVLVQDLYRGTGLPIPR